MLKSLKFLFAFALILSLSACGDDEDSTSSTDLAGIWEAQSFDLSSETSFEVNGVATSTTTAVTSASVDYELTLTDSDFMTTGGYSYNVNAQSNGMAVIDTTLSVSNVTGQGSYTTSGDVLTTNGSFFEFEFDGADLSAIDGPASSNFSIDGNTLTLTQDQEMTMETGGITSVTTILSTSIWTRQ